MFSWTGLFVYQLDRYGLPFVSPNNLLVSTINGTGAVIESIYVLIFIAFAPKKEKKKISALLLLVLTVFAAVALVSMLALHGSKRKLFCGIAATIFSIIMYGSPLSIIVSSLTPFRTLSRAVIYCILLVLLTILHIPNFGWKVGMSCAIRCSILT